MIYQADAKEALARQRGLPPDTYFNLPYEEWLAVQKETKPTLRQKVSAERAETALCQAAEMVPAAADSPEFNWKGSVGDFAFGYMAKPGERNVWQVRDRRTGAVVRGGLENLSSASNAAQRLRDAERAPPEAKFSKGRLHRPEGLTDEEWVTLKARLSTPEIIEAIAAMAAIPPTHLEDGTGPYAEFGVYNSPEWWERRVYDFDGDRVRGAEEAIPLLVERARNLAIDELNDDRKKNGEPPLERFTPDRNRKATIVIGPPASGKSTIANAIALRMRAAIADVDDAKKVIPEYRGWHWRECSSRRKLGIWRGSADPSYADWRQSRHSQGWPQAR